jgi:hypothetical protein
MGMFTVCNNNMHVFSCAVLYVARSIVYPGAADVVLSLFRKEGWNTAKKEIVDQVPKDRWPGVKSQRPMPFKFHS